MLALRLVTLDDSPLLFAWINRDEVRTVSGSTGPITPSQHEAYMARAIAQDGLWYYVAMVDGIAIGTGRIELCNGVLMLSYYVDAAHRGNGYGSEIIQILTLEAKRKGYTHMRAIVRIDNAVSLRALLGGGFTLSKILTLEQML